MNAVNEQLNADLIKPKTRSIMFYACGGTGINLLRSHREDLVLNVAEQNANEHFAYIDTSFANLHNVSAKDTFTLKGLDGSGSNRPKNAEAIMGVLPQILLAHEPKDMNVVLFSASGGSGSVAGPLIMEELLKQGKMAVAIIIGSHETLKRTTNTIGTLTGLEQAVARIGRPIVMFYAENNPAKSIIDNNLVPKFVLGSLNMLGSGRNKALDSADIQNMFDFHLVSHNKPGLAMLDVFTKTEDLQKASARPIAYISLLTGEDQVGPQVDADYDKTGYLPADAGSKNNFFYTVSVDHLSGLFDRLNTLKSTVALQKQNQQATTKLSDAKTVTHATGLVFE